VIRGSLNAADMWQFSYDSGMRVVSIEEFHDKGWRWAAEEVRKVIGGGSAYLSFDVDSLDPVYAPGTGTPEPGGLTTLEAQRLIRDLGGLDFVGADLVEVSPPFRFTRLTNAFSKKVENHAHSVALFAMYCNFVRIHKTLRIIPAMDAGVTKRLWEIGDMVDVLEAWEQQA
jgi:arginase family enzyme